MSDDAALTILWCLMAVFVVGFPIAVWKALDDAFGDRKDWP